MKLKNIVTWIATGVLAVNGGLVFITSIPKANAEEQNAIYKEITYYNSEQTFLLDSAKKTSRRNVEALTEEGGTLVSGVEQTVYYSETVSDEGIVDNHRLMY